MDEETQIAETKNRQVDIPSTVMNQRLILAGQLFKANCFGSDVKNPEQAFVKIMAGAEMGMGAMESMNSLYIVNGKITIWGSALSRRVKEAGWEISYEEDGVKSCKVSVKRGVKDYSYTATKEDVEALNSQAYKKAPKDKLKWHALSRLVRFYIPEVLGGSVSYSTEEYEDVKVKKINPVSVETEKSSSEEVVERIKKADDKELKKINFELPKLISDFDKDELDTISHALKARYDELNAPVVETVEEEVVEAPVKLPITPAKNERKDS